MKKLLGILFLSLLLSGNAYAENNEIHLECLLIKESNPSYTKEYKDKIRKITNDFPHLNEKGEYI